MKKREGIEGRNKWKRRVGKEGRGQDFLKGFDRRKLGKKKNGRRSKEGNERKWEECAAEVEPSCQCEAVLHFGKTKFLLALWDNPVSP